MATHISQIYPCSKVELPCEVYYMIELGKYLTYYHQEPLSVKGVIFADGLENSKIWQYFKIAIEEGWVVDTGLGTDLISITYNNELTITSADIVNLLLTTEDCPFDAVEHEKRKDATYALRTPKLTPISFAVQTPKAWLWNIEGENKQNITKNNKMLGALAEQSVVSLLAYVAISRVKTGQPTQFLLEFDFQSLVLPMTLSYFILLDEETPALRGWTTLHIDDSVSPENELQIGYAAWYIKGKDKGELSRHYTLTEKKEKLKQEGIGVGDIVLMYKRKLRQHNNYFKDIESCRVCKILSLNGREMQVEYINTVKTYAQRYIDFISTPPEVQQMYSNKPYLTLNTSVEKLDLGEVGVGYCLFAEEYLLLPLSEANDVKVQIVDVEDPSYKLRLTQNDLIYWIFSDYDYAYNKEHFLAQNFKTKEPLYERYKKGDTLADYQYESESEGKIN